MTNSESDYEEDSRFYLGVVEHEEEDVRYCQELSVEWVKEVLTKTGGFGDVDPSTVEYDADNLERQWGFGVDIDGWNNLEFPTSEKINRSMNKPELVRLVESACKIIMGQTVPIIEQMAGMGDDTVRLKKFEKELRLRSEELIKTQRDLVSAQEELLKIQRQLLDKREEEITAVQSTAQQEMKSFAAILEKGCASALAPKKIQTAIAAASEDRGCNIIIHGLEELNDKSDELETQLKCLFAELDEAPKVISMGRMGKRSQTARPVKVVLRNRDTQTAILRKKSCLKGTEKFSKVFISPDRTLEERNERKKLVDRLKDMIKKSPDKHYAIRGKDVVEIPSDT